MSSWEPAGARFSACSLQLLESSQRHDKGESIEALMREAGIQHLAAASVEMLWMCKPKVGAVVV